MKIIAGLEIAYMISLSNPLVNEFSAQVPNFLPPVLAGSGAAQNRKHHSMQGENIHDYPPRIGRRRRCVDDFRCHNLAQSPTKPILKTSVYELNRIEDQSAKYGSKRQLFDGRTAMLDQLECHVTTVNPGDATHPPVPQAEEELVIVKDGTVEAVRIRCLTATATKFPKRFRIDGSTPNSTFATRPETRRTNMQVELGAFVAI